MGRLKPNEVDEILGALYGAFKDELTDWESRFIGSLQAQWSLRHSLTERQERKLDELWETFASGRRRRSLGAEPDTDPGERDF